MRVFVDTSAVYAAIDADDARHADARRAWARLLDGVAEGSVAGVTHSAVVVESSALVQRRLGMAAVRVLHTELLPVLDVVWVDASLHGRAVAALLAAGRRDVSLVDWMSFELMRELGLVEALAFDDDFAGQGFATW